MNKETPKDPKTREAGEAKQTRSSSSGWLPRFLRRRKRGADVAAALALRPMTRGMQAFAMTMFFIFGLALAAFLLTNPFDLDLLQRSDTLPGEQVRVAPAAEDKLLYQCPMHPAVIEKDPGDCPICSMKLMPMASGEADGRVAETSSTEPKQLYQCPMHPDVIEEQPGNCPICSMKLTPMKDSTSGGGTVETARGEREILYWYAPMDPTYIQDSPGKSPMGMDLVPKYADQTKSSGGVIQIDPAQVQNIGVVSTFATVSDINRTVRTVGYLDFNADEVTWVNTKFSGWIEKVHVNYVGQEVSKGQPLFEIYSPELVTTQEEYLRALDYRESLDASDRLEAKRQAESLLNSTRDRLAYWDISDDQIRSLEERGRAQRRLTVSSPADGVITEVMDEALEGLFVEAGMNLYKIVDLSTIWVHADVYETDLPWVRENQPAEVSFRNDPERVFRGQILFLYPEVSKDTRTLKICVEVPNNDRRLRAGMYADVIVYGPPLRNALLIPNSAVLRSGERNLVFVDLGQGRFEPREVVLGIEGERAQVQIRSGLAPGEAVVTQAQFMLDSESRVQEAIAKFMKRQTARSATPGSPLAQQQDHGGQHDD